MVSPRLRGTAYIALALSVILSPALDLRAPRNPHRARLRCLFELPPPPSSNTAYPNPRDSARFMLSTHLSWARSDSRLKFVSPELFAYVAVRCSGTLAFLSHDFTHVLIRHDSRYRVIHRELGQITLASLLTESSASEDDDNLQVDVNQGVNELGGGGDDDNGSDGEGKGG
ncbi:hypothetical protein F5878DRAFT_667571 [Lentinula raphanica]|uniref:Uncharacterized protein n=1 Tax=Lentinula raphanica TaxID=153919 RepID=A0AA38U364_9AGAR|nr:hypothetical protein F5878DRAFT_667571 [Lentinula raphanica]